MSPESQAQSLASFIRTIPSSQFFCGNTYATPTHGLTVHFSHTNPALIFRFFTTSSSDYDDYDPVSMPEVLVFVGIMTWAPSRADAVRKLALGLAESWTGRGPVTAMLRVEQEKEKVNGVNVSGPFNTPSPPQAIAA